MEFQTETGTSQDRTIREAFAEASSFFAEIGVQEPESNARLLLEHVLGTDRTGLMLRWSELFPVERAASWRAAVTRKGAGEPVQYITGWQEFYGLPFTVTPAVLIPRPETELLVEAIVRHGRRMWPDGGSGANGAGGGERPSPLFADIGTGSGAIAITAAGLCPAWRFAAVDISPAALAVARENAVRNGVGERIRWMEGDLLLPLTAAEVAPDILVSNPPYIPTADLAALQPEVRVHEPRTALDGGPDGLGPYRRMAEQMAGLAAWPRLVGFETGMGQARDVAAMLERLGRWDWIEIVPDLAGIERHVLAGREA
ncbi:peptide chain release factor N(5)-glutamine methyltransferase [Gorillibacterium massiliense]|uniref:peptide chain release factor N(5)-glutamine methyltransferase n=1 Tax=Gorillibacterium massiliense TaxID=1280390 RepID=UPI0004ADCCDD|nr:peptide chain release factor N(5)-glutamine methyltransferase [Gorillibacterium massiliense]